MSVPAQGIVSKPSLFKGKVRLFETSGEIYFVLLTEIGEEPLADQEFRLKGQEIDISDKTDANGEFRYSPAEYGEYELQVSDAVLQIPAVVKGSAPYMVHVPYVLLPEKRQWEEPTEEELGEAEPEAE